jgi:hypothetical protein
MSSVGRETPSTGRSCLATSQSRVEAVIIRSVHYPIQFYYRVLRRTLRNRRYNAGRKSIEERGEIRPNFNERSAVVERCQNECRYWNHAYADDNHHTSADDHEPRTTNLIGGADRLLPGTPFGSVHKKSVRGCC